ncbi:MAG: NUDIX hydrolase [Candidatus Micrarchaeia archaeon]|jgi:8-oxo-dGTP pyrophosphatase MutT (NUDIX family)
MPEPLQVAGVVVINNSHEVLFLKRSQKDDKYPGLWNIVAGTKEPGESIEETARRELEEETGLSAAKGTFSKLVEFDHFIELPSKKIPMHVTLFVFFAGDEPIRLSEEHSAARFIPIQDLPIIAASRGGEFTPTDVLIMEMLGQWLLLAKQKVA